MKSDARVIGDVEYRAGDGPLVQIPKGVITVEETADSAVISWDDDGNVQTTAIPREDYERYVSEGAISKS
ncbi:MAG: hypothetical protein KKC79_00050 [Gammaproteobacteria bacterium]|nr:hypothetical protein [Gammaproteobacteria bacterium]MBU1444576.1 hypothetical protein [Gammaproteobacteria bacterium]MBU2285931.1 hypothetical protein [Gammaproteobacteria bacterium]MBU2407021.1 hypothetical protein [Gammaproteobacteria bacterium]